VTSIRIGCGSAAAPDPVDGAVAVLEHGDVDYLCFDTMAEISMPAQQITRMRDPEAGYDLMLEERMRAVLPLAVDRRVRIIGNFGVLNPAAAARAVVRIAADLGLHGLRVACIEGDDVLDTLDVDTPLAGTGITVADLPGKLVSANAYIGAEAVARCLSGGADVVVAGRVADASLYLAPMVHEFGWAADDWDRLGAGVALGHLAECGSFATGGAWSDPGHRDSVPGLGRIGRPIIEVDGDLDAFMTKPAGTGGVVHVDNFRAQLMHEINDPRRYLSPDTVADFTTVLLSQESDDRVRVSWTGEARGAQRPDTLKVVVGTHEGYIGEAMLLATGDNAVEKAQLIAGVARERLLDVLRLPLLDLRHDFIGLDSTVPGLPSTARPHEVMVRIAGLAAEEAVATEVARFADYVSMSGPLGIGARRRDVRPCLRISATTIARDCVRLRVSIEEVR
jgi:hypothetical protein